MTSWPAPRARGPVGARVDLPGSKSLTNRVLVLAALADGPSRITAPLRARDTLLMADALRALGVGIVDDGADWVVQPNPIRPGTVDTGLAGTVMRFVPPLAALAVGDTAFDGDAYARERPMATMVDGLRQAGVTVLDDGRNRLPFVVRGGGEVPGGPVRIDASASSQFVSGLLLSAPRFAKGVEITHTGSLDVPSQPHLEMTLATLLAAGVSASRPEAGVWRVEPGPIEGRDWEIEPDLSNAAPFVAAALVTSGTVLVNRWPRVTTQPGDALRDLLTAMGAEVGWTDQGLSVRGTGTITGLDADLRDTSELATVIAVLAALADGPSRLRGLAHMRGHETDRLAALSTELTRLGGEVIEDADSLTIYPRPMHGGVWQSYADHRMATAGALLGLAIDGVEVEDIGSTGKTLPDFPGMWTALVGAIGSAGA